MNKVTCNGKLYHPYDHKDFDQTNLGFLCGKISHEFDLSSPIDEPRCRCYDSKNHEVFLLRTLNPNWSVDVYLDKHHECTITIGFDDDDLPAYFITRPASLWLFCQNEFDAKAESDPELRFDIEAC